jgi:hypothetical protein
MKEGGVMTALFQSFQQDMARHLRDPHHTMRAECRNDAWLNTVNV